MLAVQITIYIYVFLHFRVFSTDFSFILPCVMVRCVLFKCYMLVMSFPVLVFLPHTHTPRREAWILCFTVYSAVRDVFYMCSLHSFLCLLFCVVHAYVKKGGSFRRRRLCHQDLGSAVSGEGGKSRVVSITVSPIFKG